jgi:ribosome-binding factor A
MLPYKRSQRVGHLLRKEVSDIIMNRVKDPRLGFLTVTDVEVTEDLKLARVYVSVLKDEDKETTFEILNSAKSFVRSELGRRLRMKSIPAVEFRLDTTVQYGARIEKLLKQIRDRGH